MAVRRDVDVEIAITLLPHNLRPLSHLVCVRDGGDGPARPPLNPSWNHTEPPVALAYLVTADITLTYSSPRRMAGGKACASFLEGLDREKPRLRLM